MKSGYWTREFIAGLFHLITPYWNSEERNRHGSILQLSLPSQLPPYI